jgi:predicted ferric reductase
LLIGAGIGVTPFISIIKTIAFKLTPGRQSKKIYFYWICRDQAEFESFKGFFLEMITIEGLKGSIELNMYVTGEMDLKKFRAENYNQYSGRPNWNRIMKEKAVAHSGTEVGVFLCGPAVMGLEISTACRNHSTKNHAKLRTGAKRTLFKFRKENF